MRMVSALIVFTAACGSTPPPAPIADPVQTPAQSASDVTARADALVEDLKRRQAAEASLSPTTERDELWWRKEMRTRQVRLAESLQRWQLAIDELKAARPDEVDGAIEAANRRKLETQEANADITRLLEAAQRENVPPAWVRWP